MQATHDFNKGDNITVFDPFTVHTPFMWPTAYYIVDVEDDYFLVRRRRFDNSSIERIPKSYPHIRKD